MIMSRRKESDGLPGVYTRLWHLLSLGLASLAGMLPQSPSLSSILHPPRTHTLPTLTHIGALNRWQARQDYLGPLPRKTIGMWFARWWACMYESVGLRVCMCTRSAAAACDSTLDAVERDVRFSPQVDLLFRLSLKVHGGGYGGFQNFGFLNLSWEGIILC